ncbi:J domain-containing protein [Endozoicomonas sp. YOMI1]|uniref:J domain-containing protein n=1 Tax=Endozoicomonas sp. YOMI1 TaxID=2828739 RepID=UPI0021495BBF|nr:J domain-containing protein [Endozoicomonas sp. YOMI1]
MPSLGPLGSKPTASKPTEDKQIALTDSRETASWGNRGVNADTNSTQTTQLKTENPDIAKVSLAQRFTEKLPHKLFTLYQALRLKGHGYNLKEVNHLIFNIHKKHGNSRKAHRGFSESVHFYLKLNKVHKSVSKNFPEKEIDIGQIEEFIKMLKKYYGFSEKQGFKKFEEVLLKTRRITPTKDQAHSEVEEALFEPIIKDGRDLLEHVLASKDWHLPRQQKFIDAVNLLGLDENKTLTKEIVNHAFRKSALKCHPDKGATDSEAFKTLKAAQELLTDDRTDLSMVSKIINSKPISS